MIKEFILVGLGGGVGSILRYAITKVNLCSNSLLFPWGTFAVNVAGCFLIGLFAVHSVRICGETESLRLLIAVGFCGGFTTFSAFTSETMQLFNQGRAATALLYVGLSIAVGLIAFWLATLTAKH